MSCCSDSHPFGEWRVQWVGVWVGLADYILFLFLKGNWTVLGYTSFSQAGFWTSWQEDLSQSGLLSPPLHRHTAHWCVSPSSVHHWGRSCQHSWENSISADILWYSAVSSKLHSFFSDSTGRSNQKPNTHTKIHLQSSVINRSPDMVIALNSCTTVWFRNCIRLWDSENIWEQSQHLSFSH